MNHDERTMSTPPALSIENLRFRYDTSGPGTAPWIVDISALKLECGEQMLLTGRSGQGKSTLLYLIAGLMEPDEGLVRVDGTIVHELRGEKRDLFRGRTIGMIFQTFNLLQGFSAMENVMAAMMFSEIKSAEHRPRAQKLLKNLDIEHPDRPVEELSVGQQQRVAVARAVACEPVLVLADEPTASLDPDNAKAAMNLIQQTCLEHGAALLCTSHDPALADRFERRTSLEEVSNTPELETADFKSL